jgi:hypothetical protein
MALVKFIVLYTIFGVVITYSWQLYEKIAFGKITPDMFDSVIAVILALSLTVNVFLVHFIIKN